MNRTKTLAALGALAIIATLFITIRGAGSPAADPKFEHASAETILTIDGVEYISTIHLLGVPGANASELQATVNDMVIAQRDGSIHNPPIRYRKLDRKWPDGTVLEWHYNDAGKPAKTSRYDRRRYVRGEAAAFERAITTWNATLANFKFSYGDDTTATTGTCDRPRTMDGKNTIGWDRLPRSVLAQTCLVARRVDKTIVETDVRFNSSKRWSTAATTPSGKFDVESVALHEMGHTFGLLDNGVEGSAMYWASHSGTTTRKTNWDDRQGMRSIYGDE